MLLLIPASWLFYSTIALIFLFVFLNVQGWIGCLVYLPLLFLVIDLMVLPKVILLERVILLLKSGRKHIRSKNFESASQCFEQAVMLQESGTRLGLSLVLSEYANFLKKFDEEEALRLKDQAKSIQIDALQGNFVDQFDSDEDSF